MNWPPAGSVLAIRAGVGVLLRAGLRRCGEAGRRPGSRGSTRSSFTVAGDPPLRGPLFMIATVGCDRPEQGRMVRDVHAVVRHLEQVDRADQVVRTDQLLLDVPGQVAAIQEVELAEAEPDRQASRVVRGIDRQVGGAWSSQSGFGGSTGRRSR